MSYEVVISPLLSRRSTRVVRIFFFFFFAAAAKRRTTTTASPYRRTFRRAETRRIVEISRGLYRLKNHKRHAGITNGYSGLRFAYLIRSSIKIRTRSLHLLSTLIGLDIIGLLNICLPTRPVDGSRFRFRGLIVAVSDPSLFFPRYITVIARGRSPKRNGNAGRLQIKRWKWNTRAVEKCKLSGGAFLGEYRRMTCRLMTRQIEIQTNNSCWWTRL